MGFETIVLVEGEQLDSLLSVLADAATRPGLIRSLRFAIDGSIKIKFNSETWSRGYGKIEHHLPARPLVSEWIGIDKSAAERHAILFACTCPHAPSSPAHLDDCPMYSPHVDNIERR